MNAITQPAAMTASPFKVRYDNYIGGQFVPPVNGRYFDNVTPITGAKICEIARSDAADIALALDAAHAAKDAWARPAPRTVRISCSGSPIGSRRTSN